MLQAVPGNSIGRRNALRMVQADYKLGRCSRRCSVEDRPLQPGETFYSVVEIAKDADDDETLARRDISAHAWQGPPEGNLGWWKNRMPEAGNRKLKLAPDAVLVDLMRRSLELDEAVPEEFTPSSEQDGGQQATATSNSVANGPLLFLFALMLMRRRLIQATQPPENGDAGRLWFEFSDDGSTFSVPQCRISPPEAQRLGDALVDLLYCEAD